MRNLKIEFNQANKARLLKDQPDKVNIVKQFNIAERKIGVLVAFYNQVTIINR
jgi:hypothetical protein